MNHPAPELLSGLLDHAPVDGHAPAVSDPSGALSWAELRTAAGRLAGVLGDLGVSAGDRVAVHLESSVETMVAVHGVLRAGAVVVPIDPRSPVNVAAAQARAVGAQVVVGDPSETRLARLAEASDLRSVVGGEAAPSSVGVHPWSEVDTRSPADVTHVRPDDPAYIISTSGSTGRPKGIVHTHRSAIAYARLAAATYALGPGDVVATLSPLHFDQSTFSLYAAPLAGASVLMVPDAVLRFPASLTSLVAERRVTVWYSVPTLLVHVLRRGVLDQRDLSALRWVLYGGESFDPDDLRALLDALPDVVVSNVYGPAEVNQCTEFHVRAGEVDRALAGEGVVPIGRAWPETEVVVVDGEGRPLRDGTVGEILVRSSTSMVGYWGAPDDTAAAFRELPGDGLDGGPWYATGDLGRVRADGELVFVGRVDNQVKVRGVRVELEAVDAAITALAGIDEAVAVAQDAAEGTRLVALVVCADDVDLRASRRSLAGSLAAAAVPDELRSVGELPRTPTGKVDRKAAARLVAAAAPGPTIPTS